MKLKTQIGTSKFIEDLKQRTFAKLDCIELEGDKLTSKYLKKSGFNCPIFIKEPKNLQMELPENFKFDTLLRVLGENHKLEVIDVNIQELENISLAEFVKLFEFDERPKTYNCISLELSKTDLAAQIKPPKIVSKLSWADKVYEEKDKPPVNKYCLLSMRDSYTDFHIDFSGTSVWYHVLKGRKRFFFIAPTDENITAYEKWQATDDHNEFFFPDLIGHEKCFEFTLEEGNTMFIPAGWIHAVLTPEDSVVFGGNFLSTYGSYLQIKVFETEIRNRILDKFKFPFFKLTHWCATEFVYKFLRDLYDDGLMTKASVEQNPIYQQFYKNFEAFREFTLNFHELMRDISGRLERRKSDDEIKEILGDQYKDLEEFQTEYKTYKAHNYVTSLRNMKEKYLDKIRPDCDLELKSTDLSEKAIAASLNNLELPQKSVNVKKKKFDQNEIDEHSPKRHKLDHHLDSTNISSSDHRRSSTNVRSHSSPVKEEKPLFAIKSAKDKSTPHHHNDPQYKDLPISHVRHMLSPVKNGKNHQNGSSHHQKHSSFSGSRMETVSIRVGQPIRLDLMDKATKCLETRSLSNYKIPKKSKVEHSTPTTNANQSQETPDQSITATHTDTNRPLPDQPNSNSVEGEDWID